jgi:UDP-glucose 4-epimerase
MKKKVLITGHKGFLGNALFELLKQDYDVYGIDLQEENDLFSMNGLAGIDIVIHCAALTSVEESITIPHEYTKTNILGTSHIVDLCLKAHAQLIYISSAAIFDPEANMYAYSKSIAHDIVEAFHKELQALIFIPYNIYGLKPKKGSLFYSFLKSPELIINGTGKQTRDFINIIDVCNIIKTAIDEEWNDEIIELGTGKQTSIVTIATLFQEQTGKKIIYKKQKNGGIKRSMANIDHLREHYTKPFKTNLKKDIEEIVRSIN